MRSRLLHIAVCFLLCLLARTPSPALGKVNIFPPPEGGSVPDAEIDSAGVIHLAYVKGNDLYYVKSADEGKTFSAPLRVNGEPGFVSGGMFRGPDLAVGRGGRIHIIWYNDASKQARPKDQWGVTYARLEPGAKSFTVEKNLNHLPSDNFSLAANRSGDVAVIWTAEGMFVNLSRDDGQTFGPAIQVNPGEVDPCECCATRRYLDREGKLYCLYRERTENLRDMYLLSGKLTGGGLPEKFQRRKVSGDTWKIEGCPMTGSFIEPDGEKGLLLGWETKAQIHFAGESPSGEELLPGSGVPAVGRGKYPVVLGSGGKEVLVAWKKGNNLEWKLYNGLADTRPDSGAFNAGNSDRPAGVRTRTGDFLLFP